MNALVDVVVPKKPDPDRISNAAMLSFGIAFVAIVVMFLFHCVIWVLKLLFDIPWDTWEWTIITAGFGMVLSVGYTLTIADQHKTEVKFYEQKVAAKCVYEQEKARLEGEISQIDNQISSFDNQIESFISQRYEVLEYALHTNLTMPFPQGRLDEQDYFGVKKCYFSMLQMQDEIDKAKETDIKQWTAKRKKLANEKIKFLYKYSIKNEIPRDVYQEFQNQLQLANKSTMLLRGDLTTKGKGAKRTGEVNLYKRLLDDNRMTPILNKFEETRNQDTSGFLFFTDTEKKAQQTRDMQELVIAAQQEYEELTTLNEKISYALGYARGCAYRNIYLGVELLNYIREGKKKSGGSLTTEKDDVDINLITQSEVKTEIQNIDADVSGVVINNVGKLISTALDNKEIERFALKNPKVALGAAALTAVASGAIEYFSKLSENSSLQAEMVKNIGIMTDGYTEGQAQALRAIEIIKAIVEANKGFMAIYNPLKEKVFEKDDVSSVSMDDMRKLALATQEYQKISKSKINGK